MSVLVRDDIAKLREVLFGDLLNDALCDNGDAVVAPRQITLYDGADDDIDDLLKWNLILCELLGDDRDRRARAASHAECEMSRRASHGDGKVPTVVRRTRVLHEVFNLHRTECTRRLKAERRNALGQREVVVDGLGNMDDVDCTPHLARILGDCHRTERRVVTADCDNVGHAELGQRLDDRAQVGFLLCRVEARHLEDTAARQMDAADARGLEAHIVLLAARKT